MKFSEHHDRLEFDFASTAAEREYKKLPEDVQDAFGSGFMALQIHRAPLVESKTLSGFGSANVRELIFDDETGTYRAAYTIELEGCIYLLHSWKKKSTQGIKTNPADIERIKVRIQEARARHAAKLKAAKGESS